MPKPDFCPIGEFTTAGDKTTHLKCTRGGGIEYNRSGFSPDFICLSGHRRCQIFKSAKSTGTLPEHPVINDIPTPKAPAPENLTRVERAKRIREEAQASQQRRVEQLRSMLKPRQTPTNASENPPPPQLTREERARQIRENMKQADEERKQRAARIRQETLEEQQRKLKERNDRAAKLKKIIQQQAEAKHRAAKAIAPKKSASQSGQDIVTSPSPTPSIRVEEPLETEWYEAVFRKGFKTIKIKSGKSLIETDSARLIDKGYKRISMKQL